jgi:hypothetical protein
MPSVFAPLRATVSLVVCAVLLATPVAAAPTIEALFRASDVVQRLQALGTDITHVLDLGGGEVLAAEYIPKQGALSEWDDESRLVLYHYEANHAFTRTQFVSKAGRSIPGRLAALLARDLDHDGIPEILAVGYPHAPSGKVTSQIFRRTGAGHKFESLWQHKDAGACFRFDDASVSYQYITLDPTTFKPHSEAYVLTGGQLTLAAAGRTP